MIVEKLNLGVYQTNSYLLGDENTREAVIVDVPDEADKIVLLLEKHQLKLKGILLTHGHCDHILGADTLRTLTGAAIYIHADDEIMIKNPDINLSSQFPGDSVSFTQDKTLKGGETLQFGEMVFKVLHTPGHTLGSVSYVIKDKCYAGDTLFLNSVGRTDLYGGSTKALVNSIKEQIFSLPDETRVYPGHGPKTTVKHEKKNNPFVK